MIFIKFLIPLTIYLGMFFLGYSLGLKKVFQKEDDYSETKKYNIKFRKEEIDKKYYIKSTPLTRDIVNFCDSLGIKILSLDLNDYSICSLSVECTKNQHFLLIQELSKPEYHLDFTNLTF